jgi:hypothetical protein
VQRAFDLGTRGFASREGGLTGQNFPDKETGVGQIPWPHFFLPRVLDERIVVGFHQVDLGAGNFFVYQ